ncbi:hypothetical protein EFR01_43510 [Sinorhizobium fredii]|nr:hypothetical protein SF83666_b48710 [Sinorhizobium fredii CCBAU 83666]GEC34180.1 hypothetical protein EFR01_43510 [Sinorhizobium fredii]GLS08203.1 hypothetical protein GCM10007864_18320 [Sinorhizobium fredii]
MFAASIAASGQHRVDGGKLRVERAGAVIAALPLPFSGRVGTHHSVFVLDAAGATD